MSTIDEQLLKLMSMNQTTAVGNTTPREEASTSEDFLNMLIAEMQSQDPLEPMDNAQYTAQILQMQTLDAINGLKTELDELRAVNLVGKEVATGTSDGTIIKGVVQSMYKENDIIYLDVGEYSVRLEDVMAIKTADETVSETDSQMLDKLDEIVNAINAIENDPTETDTTETN